MGPAAAASEGLARHVLENLLEGCQVIGFDYTYLYVNDAVVEQAHTSREALIGHTMVECFPGIDTTPMFRELERCMEKREHHRLENEFTYPDGSTGWFELRFVPVPEGTCVLSIDITERKRAAEELARTEAQLRHAQKMETVGRLAGGVVHDVNNLLSVVLSYTSLLLADLPQDDLLREDIGEIHAAGERAAEVMRQLLAISRQQGVEPRALDLNQIVGGLKKMLVRLLGADVELTVLPSSPLGRVWIDPGTIEQLLLNLVINARDAMPTGGKLTIETRNVDLDEDYAASHPDVTPGPYVMVGVSDTGVGMDATTQARLFEPFYTTKDEGRGTGLGLSMAYDIVKQGGGHIWFYSERGVGTTFKIYLPRIDGVPERTPSQPPTPESTRGSETILVVEDNDQVRAVACTILRRGGYRVLEASNGGEALLVCEQHPATIHLLLTDVVLPKLSGRQLAERLEPMRPGLKVLFMSGYADEAIMQHGVLESAVAFLQKPITPAALTCKVRDVLAGS